MQAYARNRPSALSCVPARSSWGNASKGAFHDEAKHDSVPALRVNVPDVRSTGLSYVMDGS
jgi:hypothetical protein